jgi:probable phosphoglycerate mutase
MVRIVLIRPGSTDYDLQGRIQGNLDMPLANEGLAEVAQTAEALRGLRLQAVHAPESQPALQSAEIIADALDIKLRKLDRLANIDLGLWQGMLVADVCHKQPKVYRQWEEQPETVCPPEGEMLEQADERVRAALTKLVRRRKQGVIGVVLPEPLLSLARRFLTQCDLGDLWLPAVGRPRWEVLQVEPEALFAASR